MLRACCGARYGLRWGSFSLATVISFLALSSDSADARRRKVSNYNPPYAAIVVDANSGAVMHANNPDAQRHPASLTKIMTLYLLFEQLEAGKLKLDSLLKVSDNAEDQPPTKLGLEEGQTIKVEDAIKGLVTRSANDAAVVIAEALGGSEEEFAKLMTQKARALGMNKTIYKNASGLPDSDQVTTARDQAILGRAIQERFPIYYKYFQTRSYVFRGQTISNHNRLLGRVEGVDGIKTGFTSASGFNLVTSVRRDKRHVVAVVLGGSSAKIRDARMRQLLNQHVASASTKRTAPMIAEARSPKKVQRAALPVASPQPSADKDSQRFDLASAISTPVPAASPAQPVAPGSTDPIRPVMVKTLNVKPAGPVQTASAAPFAGLPRPVEPPPAAAKAEVPPSVVKVEAPPTPPGARPGVLGTLPLRTAAAPATPPAAEPAPAVAPRPIAPPAAAAAPPATVTLAAATTAAAPSPAVVAPPKQPARTGWFIQVGAYPEEEVAKQRLDMVKGKAAKLLAKADPFTESTVKDGTTYYRARFAVHDRDQAEAACKFLKRNDVECMAIKN